MLLSAETWVQVVGMARVPLYREGTDRLHLPAVSSETASADNSGDAIGGEPAGLVIPLRQVVHDLDANQPIFKFAPWKRSTGCAPSASSMSS
jgi:hypothetical protein